MKTLIAPLLALSFASPAVANPDEVVLGASLRPGWATDAGTQFAGLDVTLAPGWKTYWRSPGEAGIPPHFDWSGSVNLGGVAYHWPVPQVFHSSGMLSIGYHDGMLLPLEVTPLDPAQPVLLRGQIDIGVCNDICVPARLSVEVMLTQPGVGDPAIKAALRDAPVGARAAGVAGLNCTITPTDRGLRLTAAMRVPPVGRDETVVFETTADDLWLSDTVVMRSGDALTAVVDIEAGGGGVVALDRSALTMTVIGDAQAVEIQGCPAE
jgi:DsbC/DsbD-like thiol-disulfide interchange protein